MSLDHNNSVLLQTVTNTVGTHTVTAWKDLEIDGRSPEVLCNRPRATLSQTSLSSRLTHVTHHNQISSTIKPNQHCMMLEDTLLEIQPPSNTGISRGSGRLTSSQTGPPTWRADTAGHRVTTCTPSAQTTRMTSHAQLPATESIQTLVTLTIVGCCIVWILFTPP